MNELEAARTHWLREREKYDAFGRLIAERLRTAVRAKGIWCETASRAKEPHSLVKKLLKGKHTYDTLPDKAGARCIVRYLSEAEAAVAEACKVFDCSDIDRKLEKLVEHEQIGYSGTHVQVRLRVQDEQEAEYPPAKFSAELQVKTLGQHAWSEMTHDSIYKSDETIARLPSGANRWAGLTAGLIEVADRQFDRLNREGLVSSPVLEVYRALERQYFKLTAKRPDPELSLQVIDLLVPLYGGATSHDIAEQLGRFFDSHEEFLHSIYGAVEDVRASAFLYQPEALMIYERLLEDQFATRKVWNTRFPEAELELIANKFGVSLD